MLFEIKVVNFNIDEFYIFVLGLLFLSYIDCCKFIFYLCICSILMDFMFVIVMCNVGFEVFINIVGGEIVGILFLVFVVECFVLFMIYVCKKFKGYGCNVCIEGVMIEDDKVFLVEDFIIDGGFKLFFVDVICEIGVFCGYIVVIFYYDIFFEIVKIFGDYGVELYYFCIWWDVLVEVCVQGVFLEEMLVEVEKFFNDLCVW